jgi:heme exporter protein D
MVLLDMSWSDIVSIRNRHSLLDQISRHQIRRRRNCIDGNIGQVTPVARSHNRRPITVPVFLIFLIFTYHFYRKLMAHHVKMAHNKLQQIQKEDEEETRMYNYNAESSMNNMHIV